MSNIYAKARILRFKISPEKHSKISQQQRDQQGMSQYKAYACLLHVIHRMRCAKIIFSMFLTILV